MSKIELIFKRSKNTFWSIDQATILKLHLYELEAIALRSTTLQGGVLDTQCRNNKAGWWDNQPALLLVEQSLFVWSAYSNEKVEQMAGSCSSIRNCNSSAHYMINTFNINKLLISYNFWLIIAIYMRNVNAVKLDQRSSRNDLIGLCFLKGGVLCTCLRIVTTL